MKTTTILSHNLRLLRVEKGLTQVQLADLIFYDSSRYCKLEGGKTTALPWVLERLADFHGVDIETLTRIRLTVLKTA
jgi:transcriptional regulator with XRE-family HTH domain